MTRDEAVKYLDRYYKHDKTYFAPNGIRRIEDSMNYTIICDKLIIGDFEYIISSDNIFITNDEYIEISKDEYEYKENKIITACANQLDYLNSESIFKILQSYTRKNSFFISHASYRRHSKLNKITGNNPLNKYVGCVYDNYANKGIRVVIVCEMLFDEVFFLKDTQLYYLPCTIYKIDGNFYNCKGDIPIIKNKLECGKSTKSLQLTNDKTGFYYIPEDVFIGVRDSILKYQSIIES